MKFILLFTLLIPFEYSQSSFHPRNKSKSCVPIVSSAVCQLTNFNENDALVDQEYLRPEYYSNLILEEVTGTLGSQFLKGLSVPAVSIWHSNIRFISCEVLKDIKYLDIDSSILENVDESFWKNCVNALVQLRLKGPTAPRSTFSLSYVEDIVNLHRLTLEKVKLDTDRLSKRTFEHLSNLKQLTLVDVGLTKIDSDAFDNLKNLESLSLEGAHIELVPKLGTIYGLDKLQLLSVYKDEKRPDLKFLKRFSDKILHQVKIIEGCVISPEGGAYSDILCSEVGV